MNAVVKPPMLVRLSLESDFRHQRARGTGEGKIASRVETRACANESEVQKKFNHSPGGWIGHGIRLAHKWERQGDLSLH